MPKQVGRVVMHALLGCATKAHPLKESLDKPVPYLQGIWEMQIQNGSPMTEGSRVYVCHELALGYSLPQPVLNHKSWDFSCNG